MVAIGTGRTGPGTARRNLAILAALGLLVLGAALPFLLGNYFMRLATTLMMYAALAWSWNFIGGFVGYPSFGIAAFFGLGAYTGALLLAGKVIAFWTSPIAGGLAAMLAAAIIGFPILRLRGHYFAVASLGVAEVFREVATSWTGLTGGGMGVNLPLQRTSLASETAMFYYAMAAVALLALVTAFLVAHSRLGVALRCIRQNEEAANMIGINATLNKITAFALSAFFAGAAGAVYASWVAYIDPSDVFDLLNSVTPPVMVLLGGAGTVLGPLFGAIIYLFFDQIVWQNMLQFHTGMLGVIIVVLVLFMPRGVLDLLRRRRRAAR